MGDLPSFKTTISAVTTAEIDAVFAAMESPESCPRISALAVTPTTIKTTLDLELTKASAVVAHRIHKHENMSGQPHLHLSNI